MNIKKKSLKIEHEDMMRFLGLDPETEIEKISQPVWDYLSETWIVDVVMGKEK